MLVANSEKAHNCLQFLNAEKGYIVRLGVDNRNLNHTKP